MSWLIESIDIAGGFLGDLSLKLPRQPGLICVIGPRGSGKSTLVEAIRFVFFGLTNATKSRQDLLQANLGQSVVTVRTSGDGSENGYAISRRLRQPPSLTTRDGQPISNVDLDRGTFLPLDAYGSQEIESIADESLGEKRRALIDELQGPEYRTLVHALATLRRQLDANADAIRLATQRAVDITERIEELGDARARVEALPAPPKNPDSQQLTEALNQQQFNAAEAQFVRSATATIAEFGRSLQLAVDPRGPQAPTGKSKNSKILAEAMQVFTDAVDHARNDVADIRASLTQAGTRIRSIESELLKSHSEQEAQYRKLEALNAGVSKTLTEHAAARQALATAKDLEKQRKQLQHEIEQLRSQRAKLRGDYLLQREQVSKAREVIAARLEKEAGARVQVRVLRNADNLAYNQKLLEGLHGARVRNHDDIIGTLLQLRPELLAEIIDSNAVDDLEAHTSFGIERSRRIMEAFRSRLDTFGLEVIEIEDRISIELNVGSDTEPAFKDASELSRGQKCTALLPLLLARRDTPLLIDQPEDNLDNHFIYETVVESILRIKSRRQMIFVTHNANIPVLGEADLIVVMNSDGRRGYVSRVGSVDACQSEIIDLLEGGREAFDLRRKRYERV